jgi:hypothetical protein
LAQHSIDQLETPPKEYQIATEVFGRPPDFDPRLDSTVRVQTGRLRAKLAEYYVGPGREGDLILSIPKGTYSVSFHHRNSPETAAAGALPITPEQSVEGSRGHPALARRIVALCSMLALAIAALAAYLGRRIGVGSGLGEASSSARTFWQPFLAKRQLPLVIFSNAEFVGAPSERAGMRYFNPATDSPKDIRDTYTGIGEAFAVHELDRVFAQFGREIRLKRSRLLTWDDARDSDLIFLGSTTENLPLRELPEQPDFVFRLSDSPAHKGEYEIVNTQPGPGELKVYGSSPGLPMTEDHALVALLPAPQAGYWVLILAGPTTLGTQGAADFVSQPETLGKLVNRLHIPNPANPVPFEAVIKVEISGGVPVHTEIVAMHIRSQRRP